MEGLGGWHWPPASHMSPVAGRQGATPVSRERGAHKNDRLQKEGFVGDKEGFAVESSGLGHHIPI